MTTYYEPPPKKNGSGRSTIGGEAPQGQAYQPQAYQPLPPVGAARNWHDAANFGAPMHFGQQADAINRVNDAMSGAAKQWHDAYQQGADRDQQMALSNNAMNTALQMKKMEVDRDREKYGVLRGLLGGMTRIV